MGDLKPRQYKRLGRIEESSPKRAAKVAGRMEKRATRTERGKAVAEKVSSRNNGLREFAKKIPTQLRLDRPDTPLAISPNADFLSRDKKRK